MVNTSLPIGKVQLWGYRCRCGHEWLPRNKNKQPKVCPLCKSANWDEPKQIRKGP